jgi:hypothetical protein
MAGDGETFLGRWSRLKRGQEPKADAPAAAPAPAKADEAPVLPSVEKLTAESDFSLFMHPRVQDSLRRVALKKLFSDPHFNAADPFEPFSGDWTVAEPISQELLEQLNQARTHVFAEEDRRKREEAAAREAGAPEADAPQKQADAPPKEENHEPGRKDA